MTDDVEVDPTEVSDAQLGAVANYAAQALAVRQEIANIEAVLNERKRQLAEIEETALPAAMVACGMTSFNLVGGGSIELETETYGSITKANEKAAFGWLDANGHGSIIKTRVQADFGRGDAKLAAECAAYLAATYGNKAKLKTKSGVNHQTLSAFVREQIKQGTLTEDMDAWGWLGVFSRQYAKITLPGSADAENADPEEEMP